MFRIKKLDIFIAKQFGLLFVGTFFICQFVLMMQFLWKYVDQLVGKGLTMDVLAQFFWYMGLLLVPQALPLAILLSALITMGNLGESSELTAIKAAGISLVQSLRSLVAIVIVIALGSFYFQDVVCPNANLSFARLLLSMKQKSPELEIPEGVFYDGIPDCNLYVQKKDMETGRLYGVMIYKITGSYDDAAIILADSGMLQSTADKKHLLLTLHSGEWFENMKQSDVSGKAAVPYRRETFINKQIVLDFDADFNMMEAGGLANNAKGKTLRQIAADVDSLEAVYDSIGHVYARDVKREFFSHRTITRRDSLKAVTLAGDRTHHLDTLYMRLADGKKLAAVNEALRDVKREAMNLEFKALITGEGDKQIRQHKIEAIGKFTLALSCIIFFFIGAPLGAIIRKGGLGIPVIISVAVFIVYYIFDNTGYRMARGGMWTIWFGKAIATMVLTPLAVWVTVKANKDSVVFNIDTYRSFFMRLFGLRVKRAVMKKEVIIHDPNYAFCLERLYRLNDMMDSYATSNSRRQLAAEITAETEALIEELSNTKDNNLLTLLSSYPYLAESADNALFRFRLKRDFRTVRAVNNAVADRLSALQAPPQT